MGNANICNQMYVDIPWKYLDIYPFLQFIEDIYIYAFIGRNSTLLKLIK